MAEGSLFFIHKDATSKSLSHSSAEERRKVLHHVQVTRLAKLRTRAGQESGKSRGTNRAGRQSIDAQTEQSPTEAEEEPPGRETRIRHDLSQPGNTSGDKGSSRANLGSFVGPFTAFPNFSPSEDFEQNITIPNSVPVCGNPADPFGSACIPIKAGMHRHIQYYLNVSHPRIWHKELDVFRGQYQFKQSAFDRIANCLTNEMSMYAMLASSASQMQYIEGIPPIEDARVLIHKAIVAASRRLRQTDAVDDNLIYDINALANAEFFSFDTKAARIHLKFVKQLIDQTGGLGRLPQFMREWFLAGDESVAAELFEQPFFHFSEYDPGPLLDWSRTSVDAERHPCDSFVQDCDVFSSCPKLEQIVLDLLEWSHEMKVQLRSTLSNPGSPITGSSYERARWLHLRAVALRSRLLHLETVTWKEEITRLALLAWAYMIMTVSGRRRTMKVMASRLKAIISTGAVLRWKNHSLLLWILIVAACASEGDSDQQAWFFEKVLVVCWRARLQARILTEDAAVKALSRFLYVEEIQRPMVHELFEALKINSA